MPRARLAMLIGDDASSPQDAAGDADADAPPFVVPVQ
jgi:hypothetical protein